MRRFPIAVLLCLVGCDQLPFVGGEETPVESSEVDPGSTKSPEQDAAKAEEDPAPNDPKTAAKDETKGGLSNTVAKAVEIPPEPKKEPVPEPVEPKGPLAINKIHAESSESYSGGHSFDITVDAVLREEVDSASVLWTKARCTQGGAIFAQIERASPTSGKDIGDRTPGDVVLIASFDGLHVEKAGTRCELEFRVASMYGGPSIELGTGCWDGTNTTTTPCAPRVEAVAASGASTPLDVQSASGEFVGTSMLRVSYEVLANERLNDDASLEVAMACDYDGTTYVEGTSMPRLWGPFNMEPGETFPLVGHALSGLEPATAPEPCDLTLLQANDTRDELDIVHRGCMRGGKVTPGTCDGTPRPAAPVRKQIEADTVDFELVGVEVTEAYGSPGQLQLEAEVDASIKEAILGSERLEIRAECKFGSLTLRDDTTMLPPVLAEPGQKVRYEERLFTLSPFDKAPKRCRFEIVNDTRSEEVLATYCWRRGKVKKGAC